MALATGSSNAKSSSPLVHCRRFRTSHDLTSFPGSCSIARRVFMQRPCLPSSSEYQLGHRSWDYPIYNLELSRLQIRIGLWGNGIGTASLGTQYVAKIIGKRSPDISVEEGFGLFIIEMGILFAPFFCGLLVVSHGLLYYAWKTVIDLRETRLFPIAFAIFWYAFLLLYPITFGSLSAFENYVCNLYLWLLVGVFVQASNYFKQRAAVGASYSA